MSTGEPWVRVPWREVPSLAAQGGHPSSQAKVARSGITPSPLDLLEALLSQRKVLGYSRGFVLVVGLAFSVFLIS